MIKVIKEIEGHLKIMLDSCLLELKQIEFMVDKELFVLSFGHDKEMIELELDTDLTMIAPDMSADEIANQVKWLYMDAKTKYTKWVFGND